MFGQTDLEDSGKCSVLVEDRLEGAGTFQKGIWDYQVREEIITKGTGRETQKRRELGKRRGNLCEKERRNKKKKGLSRQEK